MAAHSLAEIIGQQAYFDRHGIFPVDQRAFVESFLSERTLVVFCFEPAAVGPCFIKAYPAETTEAFLGDARPKLLPMLQSDGRCETPDRGR